MEFSVLIPIYKKEEPRHLRECLDSLYNQTLPATEIILVEDGPLTSELDESERNILGASVLAWEVKEYSLFV